MTSRSRRFRRPGVVAAGTVAITVLTGTAITAWAQPASSSPVATGSPQAVIVVLRDQVPGAPADAAHVAARTNATAAAQRAVLARLRGPAPAKVTNYVTGNAFAATVTPEQAQALATDPAVAGVVPDKPVPVPVTPQAAPVAKRAAAPALAGPATVSPKACSTDPAKPLLEPEALQSLNVRSSDPKAKTAAALGFDGKGVKVAYIADGINPQNKAFIRKDGTSAIVDYKDFYGDGPNAPTGGAEAFGDAGSIAAQGNVVYDVAQFANPKVVSFPGGHCYIRVQGVAPGATVVALKAGSELLPNSAILQAIDYAVRVAKVDVLNESFGADVVPDSSSRNTIQLFNDQAVKAGVTVTVSTGDAGVTSTIGNPSTDPLVISTGATTDSRIYEQTGYAFATLFGNGSWLDNNISALSSAGITEGGRTIDVSAPGEADWAPCDSSTTTVDGKEVPRFANCTNFAGGLSDIQPFGGTSQSAPLTAGVAALVIQAYKAGHKGAAPSPALVKKLITSTARDLGLPGQEQGSGLVDARAAVEAALTYPGAAKKAPAGVASNIALSANQLTLEGAQGGKVSGKVTVTNVGTSTVKVTPATRTYADLATSTQTVAIDAKSTDTAPYPTTGVPWVTKKVTFTVKPGADRLTAAIAWAAATDPKTGAGPVVRLSLFTPSGAFATNTRPQGGARPANYGFVDVPKPQAGRWTAVLYTPATTGFTGNVTVETTTQKARPVGTVSGPVTLKPGASAKVAVTLPVQKLGGDTTYTLSLKTSAGRQVAVPVIVRALIGGGQKAGFTGTITGGNARGGLAERFSYALDVPKGRKDLDVLLALEKNPADTIQLILVDPQGEIQSLTTNAYPDGKGGANQGTVAQAFVAAPQAGRWRIVVVVANPVSGEEIRQQFIGVVGFDNVLVSAPGLPNSSKVTLPAGTPVTLDVTVNNPGLAPLAVAVDGRLNTLTSLTLAPAFGSSTLKLPQSVEDLSQLPGYFVPSDTKSVSLTATSSTPAQVELNSPAGGIDVFGDLRAAQAGNLVSTASVSESKSDVGLGYWFSYVQQIGPFSDAGAPAGTSTLAATAVTKAFDPAVTSSTGDPFLTAVNPKNTSSQVVIAPGKSATIKVTVTPTGAKGTVVSGVLNIVSDALFTGVYNETGQVLAKLPYTYTIG